MKMLILNFLSQQILKTNWFSLLAANYEAPLITAALILMSLNFKIAKLYGVSFASRPQMLKMEA